MDGFGVDEDKGYQTFLANLNADAKKIKRKKKLSEPAWINNNNRMSDSDSIVNKRIASVSKKLHSPSRTSDVLGYLGSATSAFISLLHRLWRGNGNTIQSGVDVIKGRK